MGGRAENLIFGLAGQDTLEGGLGDDFLKGGEGNDLYIIRDKDQIIEIEGEGIDTVNAYISTTLSENVENLMLLENNI